MKRIAFYYDVACPYAYLASTRIDALAARAGARLEYRPFLLGGLFKAIGAPDVPMSAMSPAKARHNRLDMDRWAARFGVPLVMPETHPNRTVRALRAILASGDIERATHALFRAYWVGGLDVSDPLVITAALDGAGLRGAAAVRRAEGDPIKDELRERTAQAVSEGVFGAPSFVVETHVKQLFWGQDRLEHVEKALAGWAPRVGSGPP